MSNVAVRDFHSWKMIKAVVKLTLFLAMLMIISSCTKAPPVIKIGLVAPFTGRHREIGYDVIYSARMAIREINESGGIGRYRVALVALDDFGDPETAEDSALSLSRDPMLVASIGHWLPETTLPASAIYDSENIAYVVTGEDPFGYEEPELLSPQFRNAYEEMTPFDEVAGPYAGSAYRAIQLVLAAFEQAEREYGTIDRKSVKEALETMSQAR